PTCGRFPAELIGRARSSSRRSGSPSGRRRVGSGSPLSRPARRQTCSRGRPGVARHGMRAVTYARLGASSVLELVDRPIPEPGDGEVRIRMVVSGVNPTDWKSRSGMSGGALAEATVPNHDGAGVVDKIGAGVRDLRVGDRVWVTLAGDGRPA